jgi:CRISPR type I-D-associated protein Csc3/Cas10d
VLTKKDLEDVLDQYVQSFVPAMQRWKYHLILAKGGMDYSHLSEQSMFGHVVNGIFSLARLLRFVLEKKLPIYSLNEQTLRKAFALYTIHDTHKLGDIEQMGGSEFSIPLERLMEEYNKLGLNQFADVDAHLMRAANVSKRSQYQGDIMLGEEKGSLLWLLVRLADTMASMVEARETGTLEGYLRQLAPEFASRMGRFCLYSHEVRDVRGVLTNLVHSVIAQRLEVEHGFYPLLFFTTGTLYLGPTQIPNFDRSAFIDSTVESILEETVKQGRTEAKTFVKEGGLRPKEHDFQSYVYTFADAPLLLELVCEETLNAKSDIAVDRATHLWGFGTKELDKIGALKEKETARRRKKSQSNQATTDSSEDSWRATTEKRLEISFSESKEFNDLWWRTYRYLLYADNVLRDLSPAQDRLEWFSNAFAVPQEVVKTLREDQPLWSKGGLGKYVLVIAYHFLKGPAFTYRTAQERPVAEVLDVLHQCTLKAFEGIDSLTGRKTAVADLGFREELHGYLCEHLCLSWASEAQFQDDAFTGYSRPKQKGHANQVCSICNRASKWVQEIRTGILGDFGRVFSNRVLPAQEAPQKNRPWCPICHLEFILRQLVGLSLPSGADYGQSYRIYLYILPTFSFTPEHPRLFERILREFRKVSSLAVRDFGQASPGLPHMWLERRELDPEWMADVVDIFAREADRIARGRGYTKDRLMTSRVTPQPHYYLLTWERWVTKRETEDARIPTRSEAWAKALFAALVITGLTSTKVYVTEHPYLQIFDPTEIKATITLDGVPPILRSIVGGQKDEISLYGRELGQQSGIERALDLASALWTVAAEVRRSGQETKDKQIAARLGVVNVEPLAGATFYKEYGRLNDDQSPFPPLARACEVLIEHLGGEMMDLVQRIAEESLKIRLPFRKYDRGKAHSYELVFREAVDAMRKAFTVIPALKSASLTGAKPSAESVAELKQLASGTLLKAMERRHATERVDGFINPIYKDIERQELGALIGSFINLIVEDVFLDRANGSFARFLHLENSIADGVYYLTDRIIGEKWESNQAARAERAETVATS